MLICCQTLAWISIMEDQIWKTQCYLKKIFNLVSCFIAHHQIHSVIHRQQLYHAKKSKHIHTQLVANRYHSSKQASKHDCREQKANHNDSSFRRADILRNTRHYINSIKLIYKEFIQIEIFPIKGTSFQIGGRPNVFCF